jgi:hypothetical protein
MGERRPKTRPDLDFVYVDGEAVIYDANVSDVHYLNHTAALVFGLADGSATARQIAADIADVYEMPEKEVRTHVRELLEGFETRQLMDRGKRGRSGRKRSHDKGKLVRLVVPPSG